ncbi:MAG: serine/threonine protein kinase [Acidobacteriia bacterium]|nr:serine/threonine protein kinase [Terriglobia bacterium]
MRIWTIADGALLRLDYIDGMQFWLDREGKSVWAQWPDTLSIEDAASYLLGPVLGLLLRLRGVTCLHASAVAFGDRAVAFVGAEGAGKSTTAAAFARRGCSVLSDDVVALREAGGTFHVLPAYPYLSLWPDSVEMLYGSGKTLPSFSENFDKRMLSLAEEHLKFEQEPLPLGGIFLLGEKSADAAAPLVETLPSRESLLALVANSYATNLLDTEMRAREFELLGRLVASVPVWRLRPREGAPQIDRLCDVARHTWDNTRLAYAHASHRA